MKKNNLITLCIQLFVCIGSVQSQNFIVTNRLNSIREDQNLVISRSELTNVKDGLMPIVVNMDGKFIPCQADDIDMDGKWDELAFVYTFKPFENVALRVDWVRDANYPVFVSRTNVRYGKMTTPGNIEELRTDIHSKENLARGKGYPYQMDGPAWENDKMGFRHYFDGRNSRDVFGKRTSDMVLDKVGIRENGTPGNTYHVLADWGRDIMSAANSFGLGGLAARTVDGLQLLGVVREKTTDIIDSTRFTLISEGPVRSIFRLDFYGWQVGKSKIDLAQIVTIWAGRYGYDNKIICTDLPKGVELITGIPCNFNDKPLLKKKYKKSIAMITHDKQTYDKVWYMGMALVVQNQYAGNCFESPEHGDIAKTWCITLKLDKAGQSTYSAYAAWELGDSRFVERDQFVHLIDNEAKIINRDITIKF